MRDFYRPTKGLRGIINDCMVFFISVQYWVVNKQHKLVVKILSSKSETILSGVPQGLILGTLLFLIYINDISNNSDQLKFHLFADDTYDISSQKS